MIGYRRLIAAAPILLVALSAHASESRAALEQRIHKAEQAVEARTETINFVQGLLDAYSKEGVTLMGLDLLTFDKDDERTIVPVSDETLKQYLQTQSLYRENLDPDRIPAILKEAQQQKAAILLQLQERRDELMMERETLKQELQGYYNERDRRQLGFGSSDEGDEPACSIAGDWVNTGDRSGFDVRQDGADFSWTITDRPNYALDGSETASGSLNNTTIQVEWTGTVHGSGRATGTVTCSGASATHISWSNGAHFERP